jgi:hypothetical protein
MSSEANVSMSDEDLDRIEAALGVKLPPEYRATMRDYPFPPNSSAAEMWSRPDADWVIWRSREWSKSGLYDRPWSARYLALGGDGGEEEYILDLGTTPPSVLTADVENGTVEPIATDWQSWLALLEERHAEIEQDERDMAERLRNKRWWEFWIR